MRDRYFQHRLYNFFYLQYQSVLYSDVSMLISYQHKTIGGSTISKRQQSGFEDGEAHT